MSVVSIAARSTVIVFFKLSYRLSAATDFQDIEYIQLCRAMSMYVMKFLEKDYKLLTMIKIALHE